VDSAAAQAGFGGKFDPKTSNNGVFADAAAFNKKVKVLCAMSRQAADQANSVIENPRLPRLGAKNH